MGDGLVIRLEIVMLDRANSGPEPTAVVLQAILHGVAAGACRVAAREDRGRSAHWLGLANEQRAKARGALAHAASTDASANVAIALCKRF